MLDYEHLLGVLEEQCRSASNLSPFQDSLAVLTEYKEIDPVKERLVSFRIRAITEKKSVEFAGKHKLELATDALLTVESLLKLNADIDFDAYILFMEWKRPPEKCFYRPRRKTFGPKIVRHMQDLADDKLDFLSINCPPRVGKSTIGIFFLTWMMGRNPSSANVMSGHSDALTTGFHKEALGLITDDSTYRFNEVFPCSRIIDKSMSAETIQLEGSSDRFPSLTCRSIGGTLTGAVEVGKNALLYLDDLVEDREQALNADRMDKLYQAYLNQLKERKKEGAKELCVMTRWVPNDPPGRIQEEYADDPRHRFVKIPALDENGQSNFDYPYDLGFSTQYYEDMRRSLLAAGEDDSWSAKFMCDPYWQSGLMFPKDELKYYDELPEGEPDAILAVCDTKDRGPDYAVQPIGYVYGQDHYIHHVICDNSLPEVFQPRLASAIVEHKADMVRYESNSAGGRVADDVAELCKDRGYPIHIEKKYSTENKETRILVDSGWIKERCHFRRTPPDNDYQRFMNMMTKYTVSGKVKHDDAPDAMSMYKRFASSLVKAKAEPMKRPW